MNVRKALAKIRSRPLSATHWYCPWWIGCALLITNDPLLFCFTPIGKFSRKPLPGFVDDRYNHRTPAVGCPLAWQSSWYLAPEYTFPLRGNAVNDNFSASAMDLQLVKAKTKVSTYCCKYTNLPPFGLLNSPYMMEWYKVNCKECRPLSAYLSSYL